MTNLINNDTVNNLTYLNYFNAISNGELNPFNESASVNFLNALRTRWNNQAVIGTAPYGCICAFPTSTRETKSNKTASNSNWRIFLSTLSIGSATSSFSSSLNSNTSTGAGQTELGDNYRLGSITNTYEYAVINNDNFAYTAFGSNGANLNTATNFFLSAGWLSDAVFSDIRSLYVLNIHNNVVRTSFRPSVPNNGTEQNFLTSGDAQYPITCLSDTGDGTTPAADLWCTDLWLRDNPSGYAVGRIPHVLLAKGAGFTLGNLYYNPTVIDGITDQKIWLCCANYGSDKLLQRVWTEGIV